MLYNGPIFLHFLNRELLRSLNIESLRGVDNILKILTLVTASKLFTGLGIIIEGEDLLKDGKWLLLKLLKSDQLELISDRPTLDESIYIRQVLYESDSKRYTCYFKPSDFTLSLTPTVYKTVSATSALEESLMSILQEESTSIQFSDEFEAKTIIDNRNNILETIRCRDGRGITISLFNNSINKNTKFVLGRALSSLYLEHYTNYIVGDIPTGIHRLDYYDRFANFFPMLDIEIYAYILKIIKISLSVDDEFLIYMRGSEIHNLFCDSIQQFVYNIYTCSNPSDNFKYYHSVRFRILGILRCIESNLPDFKFTEHPDFFFETALDRLEITKKYFIKLNPEILQFPLSLPLPLPRILPLNDNFSQSKHSNTTTSNIICKNETDGIVCDGIMNLEISPFDHFYVCSKNSNHRYRK